MTEVDGEAAGPDRGQGGHASHHAGQNPETRGRERANQAQSLGRRLVA